MSSIFDFDEENPFPSRQAPQQMSNKSSSIFDNIESVTLPPPRENLESAVGRNIARGTARAAETALGAPRSAGEFLESIVPEKALKTVGEKIGLGEEVSRGIDIAKKYAPYKLFPKSEDIRQNVTKYLFGEKLEPKNQWEKKADDLVMDFAALTTGTILPGSQLKVLKPALVALGGNLAAETAERVGASDKTKNLVKLGVFLLGSLVDPKGTKNLNDSLYDQARAARPENVRINDPNLSSRLNNLEKTLKRGGSETWKGKVQSKIDEIRERISPEGIEVAELEEFKKSIGRIGSELYKENIVTKPGMETAKRFTTKLSKVVDNTLKQYGKVNPAWEVPYRKANEVFGALAESAKVRNILAKFKKSTGVGTALSLFGITNLAGPVPALTGAAIGGAGLVTGELIARVWKSPTLRKYYGNVVKGALKDDAIVVQKNLEKLEKGLEEHE